MNVLTVLQEFGVDMLSAIEIPDNAGRTPIYEAIDNHEDPEILRLLLRVEKMAALKPKSTSQITTGKLPCLLLPARAMSKW
jgi:hypothetical protein